MYGGLEAGKEGMGGHQMYLPGSCGRARLWNAGQLDRQCVPVLVTGPRTIGEHQTVGYSPTGDSTHRPIAVLADDRYIVR